MARPHAAHPHAAYTLLAPTQASYRDRGSRFEGYAWGVQARAGVDAALAEVKQGHPEAHHLCYAWKLGAEEAAQDAGEPSHSAGAPILRRLRSHGLTHALVVVVRYFGGTKLGIPGLIQAYGETARLALAAATVVPLVRPRRIRLVFDYAQTAMAQRILSEFDLKALESRYSECCEQVVEVPEAEADAFCSLAAQARLRIEVL
ncbi:MAG: IMPACT family protein [Sphingobacteriia bacterium]